MLDANWRSKEVFDLCKLACAAALFASPWLLDFADRPAWNLWVCGYAMVTIALADLTAEADWEARTSFYLGAWLLAAPWVLGFAQDVAATLVHIVGGGIASLLSVAELWSTERTPPRRFQPGAACHAATLPASDDLYTVEAIRHYRRQLSAQPPLSQRPLLDEGLSRGRKSQRDAADCRPIAARASAARLRPQNCSRQRQSRVARSPRRLARVASPAAGGGSGEPLTVNRVWTTAAPLGQLRRGGAPTFR
jgi:SPW repeat